MVVKLVDNEDELKQVFAIRTEVFVDEQGVAVEAELDEHEASCQHVLVYYEGVPAGTGRLRIVDERAKLERICVLAKYRKYGLGKVIVQKLEELAQTGGHKKLKLHGQTHAEGFYKSLGYLPASDIFMEEDIPHLLFLKEI